MVTNILDGFKTTKVIHYYSFYNEEYISENADSLDWKEVSTYCNVPALDWDFILKFKDCWDWNIISMHHLLDRNFILFFKDFLNWDKIQIYQSLDEDLKKIFKSKLKPYLLHYSLKISDNPDLGVKIIFIEGKHESKRQVYY